VIGLWDGLNARMAENLSFDDLLAEVNALRREAMNAQAQQKAAGLWQQAEEMRRNAISARKNQNLLEAKNLLVQSRQQYEAAQAMAMTPAGPSENAEVVDDKTPDGTAAEVTPTMQPASVRPEPTAFVQPTIERRPEPAPPAQNKAAEDEDRVFTIREKEFMQYVTSRVNPVLPPQAKNAGVAGPVVIRVYLSRQGHLSKAEAVEGDPLLREAALSALRQWSFRPFLLDRVPTKVKSEITIYVR
jgi:TonB family protein